MLYLEFLKLVRLQGDRFASVITQGGGLGEGLLPFQGVLLLGLLPFTFPFGR